MRPGYVLDAGALIAFERNERETVLRVKRALAVEESIVIPAGALAQVWRDGRRQALLASLVAMAGVEIEALDDVRARASGQLCGLRVTTDVIDASVVLCARTRGHRVITSDPEDLARLDPQLELIVV